MSNLLTMDFDTERLTAIEETNKTEYSSHLSDQRGMIQPFGNIEDLGGGIKIGQAHRLFCERIDIEVGDKVIYDDVDYIVKTIKDFEYGCFPHKELLIIKM